MRTSLQPYVNQYVLCKGWIADWEDMPQKGIKRIYITQPTIKKPNKNLKYEEQERISTEHHLNLFIKEDELDYYDAEIGMHKKFAFTGFINEYRRRNGTIDYGIIPNKQSKLHYQLDAIGEISIALSKNIPLSPQTLIWMEKIVLPQIEELSKELEEAGDYLPTFNGNYDFYRKELDGWKNAAIYAVNIIRSISSNRGFRRRHKVPYDFAKSIEKSLPVM